MDPSDFIKSYKIKKLVKAMRSPNRPGTSINLRQSRGQEPNPKAPAAGSSRPKEGFPVGTVRNGRKKISSNPSRWVDVGTGRSFGSHDHAHDEHHSVKDNKQLSKIKEKVMKKLKDHLYSDDLSSAGKILESYLQKRLDAKNMLSLANSETKELGAVPKDYQAQSYKMKEEADKLKESFIKFVKIARKKAKARRDKKDGQG